MTENERRAEWAGFKHDESNLWLSPDGVGILSQHEDSLPPEANFTDPYLGIAYCFKWLLPEGCSVFFDNTEVYEQCFIGLHEVGGWQSYYGRADKGHQAKAFCRALDKLIESEVKE